MVLPGLRSTDDMGTDGRPLNWREGLLLLSPRNNAPLYALTAAMSSAPTDDPQFNWWEETVDMLTRTVNGETTGTTEQTVVVDSGWNRHKPGDLFLVQDTDEVIQIESITSDTSAEVERGAANSTEATIPDGAVLIFMGSAYAEGAAKATGTSYNPTKKYNYTQIFREPVEWTRTALKTRLRYTKDIKKEDKRRAMHKHSVGLERAFWLGRKYETTASNGQPLRYTGGLIEAIPSANKVTVSGGGGLLDMDELMSYFTSMFAYGNSEKMGFCSLFVLQVLGEVVRKNSNYEWGPREKEYGMDVRRLYTPAGTLVLKEHPLFGQSGGFLYDSIVAVDTDKLKYRYITDTTLLPNREPRGTDGEAEEYLAECGLEFHNTECFYQISGITGAKADSV